MFQVAPVASDESTVASTFHRGAGRYPADPVLLPAGLSVGSVIVQFIVNCSHGANVNDPLPTPRPTSQSRGNCMRQSVPLYALAVT